MVVKISDLTFKYRNSVILEGISLEIRDNDFVAIVGRNGSGKTTLVKIILGLLEFQQGKVEVYGQDIRKFRKWEWIGYVPQSHNFDSNFPASVREILRLRGEGESRVSGLLKIDDLLDKRFSELSGGQQQRVLIAFSLISNPRLLILDEPTVGVDAGAQQEFYALLKKINMDMGVTVVLVTHDVAMISKYVKNVICLSGKECCCGSVHQTKSLLRQVYGDDFTVHHH